MSASNLRLIAVNAKMGNLELAVKIALIESVEPYGQVYLDNAYDLVSVHMTRSQFAGYLSSLTKQGFYKTQGDDFFGMLPSFADKG